jgi:signal transduction histidine kinase/DNA-binding response OmpR family regulator
MRLIFTFCCFLSFYNLNSQTAHLDSLKLVAAEFDNIRGKVNTMVRIVQLSIHLDYEQTERYLDSIKYFSEEDNYTYGKITHAFYTALYFENLGKYDSITILTTQAEKLLRDNSESFDPSYVNNVLYEIFNLKARSYHAVDKKDSSSMIWYQMMGNLQKFMDTTSTEYKYKVSEIYRGLGNLYYDINPQLSLEYHQKSLKMSKETGQNLTAHFNNIYHTLKNLGKPRDSLLMVLDSAIHYGVMVEDKWWLMEAYTHKCVLLASENPKNAEYYCNQADSINQFFNSALYSEEIIFGRAIIAGARGETDKALNAFDELLKLRAPSFKDMQLDYYEEAIKYFNKVNDKERVARYAPAYIDSLNTYYKDNVLNSFLEAETKYATAEKEKQIALQELQLSRERQNKNQIIGGGIFLLLFSSAIGLWYYQRQTTKKTIAELALENEKKEKEKLKEMDTMKTQFFTNVSHELKTPLTLILGPLQNVIEKIDNTAVKKNLLLAFNNAEKLNDLVNETLDLAKLEKGKIEIVSEIRPLAKDLIRSFLSFSSLAEMRDIRLEGHVHIPEDTYASYDAAKVEKVLNNLVSNAIKFSSNNNKIEMHADIKDGLTISIKDYGKGIAENEQEKIFNRFYQASHNKYESYGGTGVGLAFSKEIAELLGGTLSVKSTPEQGSTFTFNIPIQIVEAPQEKTTEPWSPGESSKTAYQPILINGEKPNILIVEDNKDMQEYLMSILEEDYRCYFAVDGYEAMRKVQTDNFHLISSDVMMPNMDGFTLKEKINILENYRSIPYIFLTARSLDEDKMIGLNLGVDDYITKPFNKNEYKMRVHNLLKNYLQRIEAQKEFRNQGNTESVDVQILRQAEKIILENISDPEFKVPQLADSLHYSQRQLSRILKQLTGFTPVNFILELRLQKAYRLIQTRTFASVSEVRYEIGIESASYFTRKFKERYGISPSEV